MKMGAIRELLSLGEGQSVEFRSDCQDIGVIGQVVCGFLNTSGGYVVCGVDERGTVIGVDAAGELVKSLEQRLQQGLSPGTLVSVQVREVGGKELLVVEVPAGKDLPYAFENVIYLRKGQVTRKADVETIRDMVLRKQVEPERWERRFSPADINEDLDREEVHSLVRAVSMRPWFRFRDSENPVMVLEDLAVSRYGRLTNAGDVLFGANPAMRYPQVRVRAACFTTGGADDTYLDMKPFEGPLVPVLESVYNFILRNTPTISRFGKNDLERRDEPLYPPAAIREGLVNAFAHRDYSDFSGGIVVRVYSSRLEIWNSGKFPEGVTPDSLSSGHISVLRNPDIAHVLYLRGYMEKMGRGSVMIRRACAERGLPLPQWSEDDRGVTLTFFSPNVAMEVVTAGTGEVATEVTTEVTTEVMQILRALDGEMSRRDLQDALGLRNSEHFRKAYLQPAIQDGLVEMTIPEKPRSSKQRYRLTPEGRSFRGGSRS